MKRKVFSRTYAAMVLTLLFCSVSVFAQNDTTKIKMGTKKIIIINQQDIDKLENGKLEFKTEILDLQNKIAKLKESTDTTKTAVNKKEIANLENQIVALQKGITDIDTQISELELQNAKDKKEKKHKNDFTDGDWDWSKWHRHNRDHFHGHWAGFELGLNNYVDKNNNFDLPVYANGQKASFMDLNPTHSWAFALNFLEYNIPLIKKYVGLTTGMGLEWNGYYFKNNVKLTERNDSIVGIDPGNGISYAKNKLRTTYLNIPLIFEIQIPTGENHRMFYIAAGVVGGVRLWSSMRYLYSKDGYSYDEVADGDYQLNTFRYGFTARIGYGALKLFANYEVTPLFKTGNGPELHPVTIGLTLLSF